MIKDPSYAQTNMRTCEFASAGGREGCEQAGRESVRCCDRWELRFLERNEKAAATEGDLSFSATFFPLTPAPLFSLLLHLAVLHSSFLSRSHSFSL